MSDIVNKAYQATPNATLRDQIMNPNFPKNEREWWAAARIEQLEAELTIQYQDGHHDGYEKGCTISKEASERYDRIDARIEKLEAALREIATYEIEDGCPCSACQHSALARAALKVGS